MATQGLLLLAVLVVLSVSGTNSRPSRRQIRLASMTQTLLAETGTLYDDYCSQVHSNISAPSSMTRWERCDNVANQYRAWCKMPQLTTLSSQDSSRHNNRVMYHTLCKYDQLRTSLLNDVCQGPVRDHCSRRSPVCEAAGQSHSCSPMWRSEACLCVRVCDHGLTHQLVTNLRRGASSTCSEIDLDPVPHDLHDVRGCMLTFLHSLKQQAQEFNDVISPSS